MTAGRTFLPLGHCPSTMNQIESFATLAASVGAPSYIRHPRLLGWVREIAALTRPDRIVWCDGSEAEYERLCAEMVAAGTLTKLDCRQASRQLSRALRSVRCRAGGRPHVHLQRARATTPGPPTTGSRPRRCARTLQRTVRRLHARAHDVRRAVLDGPARQPDRACRHRAVRQPVRRRQHEAHDAHGPRGLRRAGHRRHVRAMRAFGRRAARRGRARCRRGPATRTTSTSCIFPRAREIWSYGSGYGGNALLGKKCFALRIASVMGRDEGWLAEHMLILGVTVACRRQDVRRRGLSERVRQDQLRDADPAAGLRGLAGDDDRRRHRVAEARPRRLSARDQSRGRLLRRRAGDVARVESERDGDARRPT